MPEGDFASWACVFFVVAASAGAQSAAQSLQARRLNVRPACEAGRIGLQRAGKKAAPDEINARIKNDKDLAEAFGRMEEHLGRHKVDLVATKATLGVYLKMNPKTEVFEGNRRANRLLTRDYRRPYVVPEKV